MRSVKRNFLIFEIACAACLCLSVYLCDCPSERVCLSCLSTCECLCVWVSMWMSLSVLCVCVWLCLCISVADCVWLCVICDVMWRLRARANLNNQDQDRIRRHQLNFMVPVSDRSHTTQFRKLYMLCMFRFPNSKMFPLFLSPIGVGPSPVSKIVIWPFETALSPPPL